MRRMLFGLLRGVGIASILFICATVATAQFRAAVQGVVSDSAGAAVPGATVILNNKDTNQSQTATTNAGGFYRFSALPPGNYSLSVEKENFSKTLVDDVKVDAEATKGQDITLQAGAITETVTVEADAAPLQTEDANIRRTITTEEIQTTSTAGPRSVRTASPDAGNHWSRSERRRWQLGRAS